MMRLLTETALTVGSSFVLSLAVKGTLVCAIARLGVFLARRSRASIRHVLYASAFVALLLLPVIDAGLPTVPLNVPIAWSDGVAGTAGAIPSGENAINALGADSGGRFWEEQIQANLVPLSLSVLLLVVWAVGVILCLIVVAIGIYQIHSLRRRGRPWVEVPGIVKQIVSEMGVGPIELLLHDRPFGPMTCGVVRPAILLPPDVRNWNHDDVERAMAHELEHVRRGDWLTLCVARTVCALYWFHPLVWRACHQLCLEAERACDDVVLRRCEAIGYADQLVMLAERLTDRSGSLQATMANRGDLSARVKALLDVRQQRGPVGMRSAVAIVTFALGICAVLGPLRPVAVVHAQGGGANQSVPEVTVQFEVASVKRNNSGGTDGNFQTQSGGRFVVTNVAVVGLVRMAYGESGRPLPNTLLSLSEGWTGGNNDLRTARFDIEAKAAGNLTREQTISALQRLLVDRFRLVVHRETKELPMYALRLARTDGRLGSGLRRSDVECSDSRPPENAVPGQPVPCNFQSVPGKVMGRTTMAAFTRWLVGTVEGNRPVQDQTGLMGTFEFALQWAPDRPAQADATQAPTIDPNGSSLFTALREQLGLMLQPEKDRVEILVIDHAEFPTQN